jgi:hypothetical protein
VINHQHYDRDDHAVEIEAGDPAYAEGAEDKPPDDSSDYTEYNIEKEAFTRFVSNLASDERRDEAQNDPRYDRHEATCAREKKPDPSLREVQWV